MIVSNSPTRLVQQGHTTEEVLMDLFAIRLNRRQKSIGVARV